MAINPTSLAAGVASSVTNKSFSVIAEDVPRKILIIGTYDPLKTGVTPELPKQIFSAEDCGSIYGFGSMVHRLSIASFAAQAGVEVFVQPQQEAGGAVAAAGELTFTGPSTAAGTLAIYIAGDRVAVTIPKAATLENIADAVVAAINADSSLPVTAAKVAVTFEVTLTAKTKGTYGNEISLNFNLLTGEELPAGVTASVSVAMAGGSGTPDISTALDGLGTGDGANEDFYTDVVHGYLQDTATLDAISTYVGEGNTAVGLYSNTVGRPLRALTGDVDPGSAALVALKAIGDARVNDRSQGIVAVPDSPNHPSEIAARTIAEVAKLNISIAAQSYARTPLTGVFPGDKGADRWTSEYDNRDSAVKSGISPTIIVNGEPQLQNVVTFYHPASIPQASNGYRDFKNIAILQNILYNTRAVFSTEDWKGVFIVADVAKVNATNRTKARDTTAVLGTCVALAKAFEAKGWIYDAAFTISELAKPGSITIRAGGTGFAIVFRFQLSGTGEIIEISNEFDTNIG